jgi:hypothetical protein
MPAGTWNTKAQTNFSHGAGLLIKSNSKLYMFFGFGRGATEVVEEYNPTMDTWTTKAMFPGGTPGRSYASGVKLNDGTILLCGGSGLADAYRYDPVMDSWTVCGAMTHARDRHRCTLLANGKVLVTGGNFGSPTAPELFDPGTNLFSSAGVTPNDHYQTSADMVIHGTNQVVVLGGPTSGLGSKKADVYDYLSNTWDTGTDSPDAITYEDNTTSPAVDVVKSGSFLAVVVGGLDGTGTVTANAFALTTGAAAVPPLPPVPLSPTEGETNVTIDPTIFTWQASAGADSYELEIATDENFTHIVHDQPGITVTAVAVFGLKNSK